MDTLHQPELAMIATITETPSMPETNPTADVFRQLDTRSELRTLNAPAVTLRELRASDAATLCSALTTEPVMRFIYAPPSDQEGFARFIDWTHQEQRAGRQITFAIVPPGQDTAVGIIQVRQCDSDFSRAEWGFVLAESYWGTGLFMASAQIVLQFLFECVGVRRLEARSVALNGRGNGVLEKLGAVREGRLRRAFCKNEKYFDETLWTILGSDWLERRRLSAPRSH
jgi:ribosomal-protein-alanine N-acetyltransferase